MTDTCLFCKIIKGEIPAEKVAETEDFLAFLDIKPITPGHVLVVPKRHCTNILDFPEHLGTKLITFLQDVTRATMQATESEGCNISINNGAASGQEVFHAHFHLIPRQTGTPRTWDRAHATPEQLSQIRSAIKAHMRGFHA